MVQGALTDQTVDTSESKGYSAKRPTTPVETERSQCVLCRVRRMNKNNPTIPTHPIRYRAKASTGDSLISAAVRDLKLSPLRNSTNQAKCHHVKRNLLISFRSYALAVEEFLGWAFSLRSEAL